MVNDGVCDCCDGSDEWLATTLSPERTTTTATLLLSLQLPGAAACTNRCAEEHARFVFEQERALHEAEEGLHTRTQWIAAYNAQLTHAQTRIQHLQNELHALETKVQRLEEAQRDVTREHDGVRQRIKERLLTTELEKEKEKQTEAEDEENGKKEVTPLDETQAKTKLEVEDSKEQNEDEDENEEDREEKEKEREAEGRGATTTNEDKADEHTTNNKPETTATLHREVSSTPVVSTTSPHSLPPPPPVPPLTNMRHSKPTPHESEVDKEKEREERITRLADQHPDVVSLQTSTHTSTPPHHTHIHNFSAFSAFVLLVFPSHLFSLFCILFHTHILALYFDTIDRSSADHNVDDDDDVM
jgi:hypothetical protein